ncbi:MAG: ANTAR domain-containing protein, partial [Deltaproteobacteria bacterium]|nr:ANTAR domain-containing protein [Deltaproteobacteria bacterium]
AAIGVMAFIEKPFREDELIAAIELAHARFAEMADLAKENERLKGAMDSRKLIERAKGMLMDTKGMKEKEAYILLRKMSMDKRLTMESVAERMLTDVKGEA